MREAPLINWAIGPHATCPGCAPRGRPSSNGAILSYCTRHYMWLNAHTHKGLYIYCTLTTSALRITSMSAVTARRQFSACTGSALFRDCDPVYGYHISSYIIRLHRTLTSVVTGRWQFSASFGTTLSSDCDPVYGYHISSYIITCTARSRLL